MKNYGDYLSTMIRYEEGLEILDSERESWHLARSPEEHDDIVRNIRELEEATRRMEILLTAWEDHEELRDAVRSIEAALNPKR